MAEMSMFIIFICSVVLFVFGLLMPIFVFCIYQESKKTNRLLNKLVTPTVNQERIREVLANI